MFLIPIIQQSGFIAFIIAERLEGCKLLLFDDANLIVELFDNSAFIEEIVWLRSSLEGHLERLVWELKD